MKNRLKQNNSNILKTIICQIITVFLQMILLCISALIVSSSDFSADKLCVFWYVIIPVSSFIGGFITAKVNKTKGFLWGAMAGAINSTVAFIINFLNCSMSVNLSLIFLFPAGIITGAAGGIIASNLK